MKTQTKHVVFRVLFYSVLFTSSFTACKKDTPVADKNTSSTSTFSNASVSSPELPATVIDQHFDFPGPFIFANHCTGEVVTVTGTLGNDMHMVINGNSVNFIEHQQGQFKGTGSLGNTYLTMLNENVAFNGYLSNGAFIINDVTIFRMISKNGAHDFMVRRVAHLTINANGVVTLDRIDFTTNCPE
jgi:hypothetical protein